MSTMREESWPEPDVIVTGQGYHEHAYSVRLVRQIAEAAYAAGQRAAEEKLLEPCSMEVAVAIELEVESQMTASGMDHSLFHREDGFEIWNAAVAAIRARDKEQG